MFNNLLSTIKNKTLYSNKYKSHPEAIIISCYFNPTNSPYRLSAFNHFYNSIKHLNHYIVECVIGDSKPQLEANKNIEIIYTESTLWHKEAILNSIVDKLPAKYKYVFWIDADVIFSNLNWMVEGVEELQTANIIQPFEYCIHLEKDQEYPTFNHEQFENSLLPNQINKNVWKSFCSNYSKNELYKNLDYNTHGHVGFAWAARREILDSIPLYDRAFVGGADHIIAHAAAGQINHNCITKSFSDNIDEINAWSKNFYSEVQGKISYVKGGLFHIWHGEIVKRQYLKRVKEFTPLSKNITKKDKNGLYIAKHGEDHYVSEYFKHREVSQDDGFLTSMAIGYGMNSSLLGSMIGGNPLGAMIGDMMNTSEDNNSQTQQNKDCENIDNNGICIDDSPFS